MPGLLLAWVLACGGHDDPGPSIADTAPSPPSSGDCDTSPLRYDTFAQPLLSTWCTPCHSSALAPPDRSGAPEGIDFDDYDDVLQWGALAATAIVEERMPPVGGLSSDERAAFATWVACGMPEGDPVTTPPTLCDAPLSVPPGSIDCSGASQGVEVAGDLAADGADLSCVCAITGALRPTEPVHLPLLERVDGAVELAFDAELPALEHVGSLSIHGDGVTHVLLDRLATIDGDLTVQDTSLQRFELPRIDRIGGDLVVRGNPSLSYGASFSNLATLEGSCHLIDNDGLGEQILFGHLERFDGDLLVEGNQGLTALVGLTSLPELGGRLALRDNPHLSLVNIGLKLQRIGHGLSVTGNPELLLIETFPALTSVGMDGAHDPADPGATDVHLRDNAQLDTFSAVPNLQEVGGFTLVGDHAHLTSLGAMPQLDTVAHGLVIEDTLALDAPPEVGPLTAIGGDLRLAGNQALVHLRPLDPLTSVGGDLQITDNPELPTSAATAFVDQLTVSGTTTVSGNHP